MTTNSDSCKCRTVADTLGLGTLADGDEGLDPMLLRKLYRYARNENNNRVLFDKDPTFSKGWINLEIAAAKQLISAFVALDDAKDLKHAHQIAQSNLEAQAWNDILSIEQPPIQCRVKIHGSKWGLRFQSADSRMRGQELVNEELPPIPPGFDDQVTAVPEPILTRQVVSDDVETNFQQAASEMLRKGGLL